MKINIPENAVITGMTVNIYDAAGTCRGGVGWKKTVKAGNSPEGHYLTTWPKVVDWYLRCEKEAWNDLSSFDYHHLRHTSYDWEKWEPDEKDITVKGRHVILTESCFDAQDSVAVFEISFYVRRAKKA